MSDNLLVLIPTDPGWIPSHSAESAAVKTIRSLCPNTRELESRVSDEIRFIDAGANFAKVRCPHCNHELSLPWWQAAMAEAFESRFRELDVIMPCCGRGTTLNDLSYDWPQGFARWTVTARNPGRTQLNNDELAAIEQASGHSLRQIWTHI
jgi:hypothetical protein